jgi:hypothetical protein
VNGRNAISWEEKLKLDVWYVDNVSFWLDTRILAVTVWKILKREGISQPGHATAQEFMGSHGKGISYLNLYGYALSISNLTWRVHSCARRGAKRRSLVTKGNRECKKDMKTR